MIVIFLSKRSKNILSPDCKKGFNSSSPVMLNFRMSTGYVLVSLSSIIFLRDNKFLRFNIVESDKEASTLDAIICSYISETLLTGLEI